MEELIKEVNSYPSFLRTFFDPNKILVYKDHCELVLYWGRSTAERPERALFDLAILNKVSKYKWALHTAGYAETYQLDEMAKRTFLHHLVLPKLDDVYVDHISTNRLDNRKSNLRYVDLYQHMQNSSNNWNSTGVKGVTVDKGRYRARIEANKKRYSKFFGSLGEATYWIKTKRKEVHGEFANHGEVAFC